MSTSNMSKADFVAMAGSRCQLRRFLGAEALFGFAVNEVLGLSLDVSVAKRLRPAHPEWR